MDYTSASGTLNFAVDEVSKTITVVTLEDFAVEGNETVRVALSNPPAGSSITVAEADGVIADNDAASDLSIAAASSDEGTDLVFTVTRSGDTSIAQSVSYATSDGTALGCSVPWCGSTTDRDVLWARYYTGAPRLRTPSELRYSDRRLRSRS